jgi:DNA-binding response OmpR family regulator
MSASRYNVLIVDDEQVILDILTTELVGCSYECTTAISAEQALEKLVDQDFDAILLDVMLPGKSGIEALRIISSKYQDVPVIMMTAVNDVQTAVEAMKLGASDYITKPFNLEALEACLRNLTNNRQSKIKYSRIEAIAQGVQSRLHGSTMSDVIIETVRIARDLGISDTEIQKWAITKAKLCSEMDNKITSVFSKLERNAMAQVLLGLTRPISDFSKSNDQNQGDVSDGLDDSRRSG